MAKRYIVNLRSLKPEERVAAVEKLNGWAFTASAVYESMELVAADVIWDSSEDFLSVPLVPPGCSVQEVK